MEDYERLASIGSPPSRDEPGVLAELGSGITVSILSHLAKRRLSREIPKSRREVTSAKDAEFSKRDDIWSQSSPAACARSIRHPGEWVKGRGITWTEGKKGGGGREKKRKREKVVSRSRE